MYPRSLLLLLFLQGAIRLHAMARVDELLQCIDEEVRLEKWRYLHKEALLKYPPILLACDQENVPVLVRLLKDDGAINPEELFASEQWVLRIMPGWSTKRWSPLHLAAQKANSAVILEILPEFIKKEDILDDNGNTPLHFACYTGVLDVVKLLVWAGADVNLVDNKKFAPLHWGYKHLPVVKFLIENGAKVDSKDFREMTPLHYACRDGHLDVVKYLIEQGVEYEWPDLQGWRALHWAAYKIDVVKYLVEEVGVAVDAKDGLGKTAYDWAELNGINEVVAYLKK